MRRILLTLFLVSTCALVAWPLWPLATDRIHSGIPAHIDAHRVSHHVWLAGFIFISAVFISRGVKNIGSQNGGH